MYKFSVNGETFKVRFGYGVLYKTNLVDRVIKAGIPDAEDVDGFVDFAKTLIGLTSELLLEGLQKYHSDRFGYDTPEERDKRIIEVCDLIDDYEEEHTEDDGTRTADGFTLYNDLQGELEKNGFLSKILAAAQTTAADQNATVVPQDHKKKAGPKK